MPRILAFVIAAATGGGLASPQQSWTSPDTTGKTAGKPSVIHAKLDGMPIYAGGVVVSMPSIKGRHSAEMPMVRARKVRPRK